MAKEGQRMADMAQEESMSMRLKRKLELKRKECVTVEENYVRALKLTDELYYRPLELLASHSGDGVLGANEVSLLFRNLRQLLEKHNEQLKALKTSLRTRGIIAPVYTKFAKELRIYCEYTNCHDDASGMLTKFLQDPEYETFQHFINIARANPRARGETLSSFLIRPVQVIPRYRLLLAEMLKLLIRIRKLEQDKAQTESRMSAVRADAAEAHAVEQEQDMVQTALEAVSGLAEHINEDLRASERRRALVKLEESLIGAPPLVVPGRYIVRKGYLNASERGSGRKKRYMFHLLTDLLIYSTKKGWKFKMKGIMRLTSDGFRVEDVKTSKPGKHKFLIATAQKAFSVQTETKNEKDQWLNDVKEFISDPQDRRSSESMFAPIWQDNAEVTQCNSCKKTFYLLVRKHHCRMCGLIFCAMCTKSRLPIPGDPDRLLQRVCGGCSIKIREKVRKTGKDEREQEKKKKLSEELFLRTLSAVSQEEKHSELANITLIDLKAVWYWVPDPLHIYLPAKRDPGSRNKFITTENTIVRVPDKDLPMLTEVENPLMVFEPDNSGELLMAQVSSHASVLHQIRLRYQKDWIYSCVDEILIAMNPLHLLPDMYTNRVLKKYLKADPLTLPTLPPHPWRAAALAYSNMLSERAQQRKEAIIITGESGSGKTETTKLVVQFLGFASSAREKSLSFQENKQLVTNEDDTEDTRVEERMMGAGPVLEAFGNAKTLRNNNSSRFGKWLTLRFRGGAIKSGSITTYLLEKTRVVHQPNQERNYHIFYQIVAAAQAASEIAENKESSTTSEKKGLNGVEEEIINVLAGLKLGPAHTHEYLNQSGCLKLKGVDEIESFRETLDSLKKVGFSVEEISFILRVLAAILHIGNMKIMQLLYVLLEEKAPISPKSRKILKKTMKKGSLPSAMSLKYAAECLGVNAEKFGFGIVEKQTKSFNQILRVPRDRRSALHTRDALAKGLYQELFDWLVFRINCSLEEKNRNGSKEKQGREEKSEFEGEVGVLDIFGFEDFAKQNTFEQLCINLASEKLQRHFTSTIIIKELNIYRKEGVADTKQFRQLIFDDNQPCIDLIEGKKVDKKNLKIGIDSRLSRSRINSAHKGANVNSKDPSADSNKGILGIMDEQVKLGNLDDEKLVKRLYELFKPSVSSNLENVNRRRAISHKSSSDASQGGYGRWFSRILGKPSSFLIHHFSHPVQYSAKGFLKKNLDLLHPSATQTLLSSIFPRVQCLISHAVRKKKKEELEIARLGRYEYLLQAEKRNKKRKKRLKKTVGNKFRSSLAQLISNLKAAHPTFVRCFKPNTEKRPYLFHAPTVMDQMRTSGILDALSIRQTGYPMRLPHKEFLKLYGPCVDAFGGEEAKSSSFIKAKKSGVESECEATIKLFGNIEVKDFGTLKINDNSGRALIVVGKTTVLWTSQFSYQLNSLLSLAKQQLSNSDRSSSAVSNASMASSISAPANKNRIKSRLFPLGPEPLNLPEKKQKIIEVPPPPPRPKKRRNAYKFQLETKETVKVLIDEKQARQKYQKFKNLEGTAQLIMCKTLRRPASWSRKQASLKRYTFQTKGIQESLIDFSASYLSLTISKCVKQSRMGRWARTRARKLNEMAVASFEDILAFTTIRFHAYPALAGYAIIQKALRQPLLRDETCLQLLKQTTRCGIPRAKIRGWMLIYLCLRAWIPPTEAVIGTLKSHIAKESPRVLPPNLFPEIPDVLYKLEFSTTSMLALGCHILIERRSTVTGAESLEDEGPLVIEDVAHLMLSHKDRSAAIAAGEEPEDPEEPAASDD